MQQEVHVIRSFLVRPNKTAFEKPLLESDLGEDFDTTGSRAVAMNNDTRYIDENKLQNSYTRLYIADYVSGKPSGLEASVRYSKGSGTNHSAVKTTLATDEQHRCYVVISNRLTIRW